MGFRKKAGQRELLYRLWRNEVEYAMGILSILWRLHRSVSGLFGHEKVSSVSVEAPEGRGAGGLRADGRVGTTERGDSYGTCTVMVNDM